MMEQTPKDLVVLAADKNMEFAVKGILGRFRSLGIREITADFRVHPENDPGCLVRGHDFLRPFVNHYAHALVLLDREGCGREAANREELEANLEQRLLDSGWGSRAKVIVIAPELEMWVWSDSPHVDAILGWEGREPPLRTWLKDRTFLGEGQIKPLRPKEALEGALRLSRTPRSSSNYLKLAQKVSLERCIDPSFVKLKSTLQEWFPDR